MGANPAWFRSIDIEEAEDNYCYCWRFYRITIMSVIDDKSGSLLANTGDLTYAGEPLIIVPASFILDVGRGPGSVSDIFCID